MGPAILTADVIGRVQTAIQWVSRTGKPLAMLSSFILSARHKRLHAGVQACGGSRPRKTWDIRDYFLPRLVGAGFPPAAGHAGSRAAAGALVRGKLRTRPARWAPSDWGDKVPAPARQWLRTSSFSRGCARSRGDGSSPCQRFDPPDAGARSRRPLAANPIDVERIGAVETKS